MLNKIKEYLIDFPSNKAQDIIECFDRSSSHIKTLKLLVKKKNLELKKLNEKLISKEKALKIQSQKLLSNEEELTGYINKLFEQQEKERIIKKIVDNVRDTLEIKEVLKKTTEEVSRLFKADRCSIFIYDAQTNTLNADFEHINNDNVKNAVPPLPTVYKVSKELYEELVINKKQLVSSKSNEYFANKASTKFFQEAGLKYFIITPVIYENKFLGIIFIQKTDFDFNYSKNNLDILEEISGKIAVAINQAKLYQELQETVERERIIKNITAALRSTLDINKLFEIICREVRALFGADRVVIASVSKQKETFLVETQTKLTILDDFRPNELLYFKVDVSDKFFKDFFEEQKIFSFSNVEDSDIPESFKEYYRNKNLKSFLALPIKKNNENWGGVFLTTREKKEWDRNQISLMNTITDQINIAIRQADLFSKINETNKFKDEFISGMSHEFRTPLNAIIGFSELLENDKNKQSSIHQKYIKNILISARHLLRLINEILDLSKIDAGKLSLAKEKFNQKTIISQISSTLSELAQKKGINIQLSLIDYIISADMSRFKQIMYNLINNAIKFTNEGGQITVYSYIENNALIIEIEDTGIGIAEQDKDKIFQRFSQIDSSLTRNQEGTGLGLALTKKLVEMHNWKIGFESEKHKGSRFWFSIPLENITKNKVLEKNK